MNLFNSIIGFLAAYGSASIGFSICHYVELRTQRRERDRLARLAQERFERRERGRILKVGCIIRDPIGNEYPHGFTIDCEGRVPALALGPHGETLAGNWTNAELVEVAKRRKEWQ